VMSLGGRKGDRIVTRGAGACTRAAMGVGGGLLEARAGVYRDRRFARDGRRR